MIGNKTYPTPRGGVLTSIGEVRKKGKIHQILECSICSLDKELFPEGSISSRIKDLERGQCPCGCSSSARWSEQQYIIRIKRVCVKHGYLFHGFNGKFNGNKTKLHLEGILSKEMRSEGNINKLFRGALSFGGIREDTKTSIEAITKELLNKGFSPLDTFKRSLKKRCLDVTCHICSNDLFVKEGLCSGVFTSLIGSLKLGQKPCRCGAKLYTIPQREYLLKDICNEESITFIGWSDGGKGKHYDSKFEWVCTEGHKCNTSFKHFIDRGHRCKTCSRGDWGYYPKRINELDTLYLLTFKNEYECFIKVGRSFNVVQRLRQFPSDYEVGLVKELKGTHSAIYRYEQKIHLQLKDFHYNPLILFGGATLECFNISALPYAKSLIENLS